MSFGISSSVYPTARRAAIFAIGKPVAFDASADDRLTRGFISMTTMSPVVGSTANWMLLPPVSTPTRRMHANAASRISWYSTSDSVWAGATVIESPVCTPIGSKFSIEHTTTQLSARSRITSSSNSFQPTIDRSIRISLIGLASRPAAAIAANSVGVDAMPVPRPPRMYAGRTMTGSPIRSTTTIASSSERAVPDAGTDEADLDHRLLEPLAVLGGRDRFGVRTDELDPAVADHAPLRKRHREVQRGLTTERRQHRVGPLALDDLREHLGRERLDVGAVGELGVGHDRRRVRVGEHDPIALGPQHAARLRSRVVELAGLTDHDRPAADDQDRLEVGAARHQRASTIEAAELVEQVARVVRPGPGLRVVLHAERGHVAAADALDDPVVQVHVRDVGGVEALRLSTAKLWFWLVISTCPVARCRTGWLPP